MDDANPIRRRLGELLTARAAEEVDYVLIGGVAINLQGLPRNTQDVDVFLRPDTENVERVKRGPASRLERSRHREITAEDLLGEYPVVRYGPPDEEFIIDLLARIGTAVEFSDLEATTKTYEGVPARVATPETLVRLKRDTIRPQDRFDADALRQRFGID